MAVYSKKNAKVAKRSAEGAKKNHDPLRSLRYFFASFAVSKIPKTPRAQKLRLRIFTFAPVHAIILTAPSGSGKTTLAHKLLVDFPMLRFSVSATTRPPRQGEIPGKSYHYLTIEDFQKRISEGAFVEWQEVYPGVFYGTLRSEIEAILAQGRMPLLDIDVKGALQLKENLGAGALTIFLMPPSIEVLRQRLSQRGTESPSEVEKRLAKAEYELTFASHFDHILQNDQLEQTYRQLQTMVRSFLSRFYAL